MPIAAYFGSLAGFSGGADVQTEAENTAATNMDALLARLQLEIEKLRQEIYGRRSERKARLLDQLECS